MILTPCQNVCQLKATYCQGCCRRIDEISQWSRFEKNKQQEIINDLSKRQIILSEPTRTGYRKTTDIPQEILKNLNQGDLQTQSLVEGLAINLPLLLSNAFPSLRNFPDWSSFGIVKKMQSAAIYLNGQLGFDIAFEKTRLHLSDTLRGIAAYLIADQKEYSLPVKLELVKPLAADPHFGVREWAWLAMRPVLTNHLHASIDILSEWVESPNFYLRRFAIESLRPRGVWSAHIKALKDNPEMALKLLTSVKNDCEKYVQDSVANWLNDAAKSNPDWVLKICHDWQREGGQATLRICQRALRSIKE